MESNTSAEPMTDLAIPVTLQDHALGLDNARYTLVEYGDYECPDCLNVLPIVSTVRERLGDELRVVYRHFPLSSVHPRASAAAIAAEAAATQGRFWEMHEMLFRYTRTLAEMDLTHLALSMGLEVYKFASDLESAFVVDRVDNDYIGGVRSGVKGTPTFFINGRRYKGPMDADSLLAAIHAA